jgi:hypothetical protein
MSCRGRLCGQTVLAADVGYKLRAQMYIWCAADEGERGAAGAANMVAHLARIWLRGGAAACRLQQCTSCARHGVIARHVDSHVGSAMLARAHCFQPAPVVPLSCRYQCELGGYMTRSTSRSGL